MLSHIILNNAKLGHVFSVCTVFFLQVIFFYKSMVAADAPKLGAVLRLHGSLFFQLCIRFRHVCINKVFNVENAWMLIFLLSLLHSHFLISSGSRHAILSLVFETASFSEARTCTEPITCLTLLRLVVLNELLIVLLNAIHLLPEARHHQHRLVLLILCQFWQ